MRRPRFVDRALGRSHPLVAPGSSDELRGYESEVAAPTDYGLYIATSNPIYACVTLRADLLSSLPARGWRGEGDDRDEVMAPHPLVELLRRVNPFWTFNRLLWMTEAALGLWGESFWVLEDSPPKEIWWVKPSNMRVVRHPSKYIAGFVYQVPDSSERIPFAPEEVIWLRYPNPLDEFAGLSPVTAARLAADFESASAKSNKRMFDQGIQLGGIIQPDAERTEWTVEQAKELEELLSRRFRGADKAHRWAIFRERVKAEQLGVTPKDAEFVSGLNWSLEAVCRTYRVPPELVAGQNRTYQNFPTALRAVWELAVLPEAEFIAAELTEQLAPRFEGVDEIELATDGVRAIREDDEKLWSRVLNGYDKGLLGHGTATGLLEVEDDPADIHKVSAGEVFGPLGSDSPLGGGGSDEEDEEDAQGATAASKRHVPLPYGGATHAALWAAYDARISASEPAFAEMVRALHREIRDEVLANLELIARHGVPPVDATRQGEVDPFELEAWVAEFFRRGLPRIRAVVKSEGTARYQELGISGAFDVDEPLVRRFIERRAQRFARWVPRTTWKQLRSSLAEGIKAQESIPDLERRVRDVMGHRIRSSSETIARTEVVGASNGGAIEAWRQSGVVEGKAWLATLDGRVRPTHIAAHARYQTEPIPLGANFRVGEGEGPAPGQIDRAEESVNCRCTLIPVLDVAALVPRAGTDEIAALRSELDAMRSELARMSGREPVVVNVQAPNGHKGRKNVVRDDAGRIVGVEED